MAHGRFDNPVVAALAGVRDFFSKQELANKLKDSDTIEGKTCIVTGANSGLGFAIANDLAKRGGKVVLAQRRQLKESEGKIRQESGSDLVSACQLDLSDIDSIHAFVQELSDSGAKIDTLILNAGVALPKARKTASGQEEMFMVNYLSNFILVHLMLKNGLFKNDGSVPRIIFVSSDSHQGSSFVDYNEFGKYIDYGVSKGINYYSYYKLVLNTFAVELSRRLNSDGVRIGINVICPGPVNTNIIKEAPLLLRKILGSIFSVVFKKPSEAAKAVVYMSISPDYEGKTSEYLHMFNQKKMDEKVYLLEEGRKLWDASWDVWKSIDKDAVKGVD